MPTHKPIPSRPLRIRLPNLTDLPRFMFPTSVCGIAWRDLWLDNLRGCATRRRHQMTAPHDDFMQRSLYTVLRRKLAPVDGAFHENVVSLVIGKGDGKIAVERQVRPFCVFLRVALAIPIRIALAEPDVGYRHSGGEILAGWLGRDESVHLSSISLHG